MRRWLLAFSVVTLGTACAHRATDHSLSSDRTVITREELDHSHYPNLYEAVAGLRRNWLQTRGADSFNNPSQIRVYLDNALLGGTESLRNLDPTSVTYLKYFDGVAATTRWGTDHGAGVIFVSLRPLPAKPN